MDKSIQKDILFSIIIPTYNRAELIGKTIESLQKQTYKGYELIIVDDGSTDNTEQVVSFYLNNQTSYHKKNNAERAAARNYGASLAKGDYINFFDSDDIALPNHLSEAANLINSKVNPEWFHLSYSYADPDGLVSRNMTQNIGETLNSKICNGNLLSCNGVFIRRDIILKNRFNEDRELSASEDYELWCRLTARFPLYYSNSITSLIIEHDLRSVQQINNQKLIVRLNLLTTYLKKDKIVLDYFGKRFKKIEMEVFSYAALHLKQPDFKVKSIVYLFKTLSSYPLFIIKKRFYVILRNIITIW